MNAILGLERKDCQQILVVRTIRWAHSTRPDHGDFWNVCQDQLNRWNWWCWQAQEQGFNHSLQRLSWREINEKGKKAMAILVSHSWWAIPLKMYSLHRCMRTTVLDIHVLPEYGTCKYSTGDLHCKSFEVRRKWEILIMGWVEKWLLRYMSKLQIPGSWFGTE